MKYFIVGLIGIILSPLVIMAVVISGGIFMATWKLTLASVACGVVITLIGWLLVKVFNSFN